MALITDETTKAVMLCTSIKNQGEDNTLCIIKPRSQCNPWRGVLRELISYVVNGAEKASMKHPLPHTHTHFDGMGKKFI